MSMLLNRENGASHTAAATPLRATAALGALNSRCASCGLREECLPCQLARAHTGVPGDYLVNHKRIKRGDCLYRTGDEFRFLFTVRCGSFKTVQSLEDGREQVTGFHMGGDMLGMDGIASDLHGCDVIALEDSEAFVIPYLRMSGLGAAGFTMQRQLHKALSRELMRENWVLLLLGSMNSEERLATFLLDLSQRFEVRGYSPTDFILRMNREEIGSFLGIKVETVSRMFTRFHDEGLISVRQKHVHLHDVAGLKRCVGRNPK